MNRTASRTLAAALVLAGSACSDITSAGSFLDLDPAFNTVPAGFDATTSSFAGADSGAWTPGRGGPGHGGGHHGGGLRGGGLGGLMGGGLIGAFLGDGMGRHHGHQPFGESVPFASCAFDASAGRNVCAAETRHGLTINRSAQFRDAAGAVQQAFDSVTTNSVNARVAVAGTRTHRSGATSTVEHASDRTVGGLASGSTQRTVNGTSAGRESTTGTDDAGSFTALRVAADSVNNVVIPVATDASPRPYPVSGSIVRAMQVTVTRGGQTTTSTRREVVTYDGTSTATLVITRDGETRTCTLPLPHGRPTCS
ncbi:MAG TPA: hypothetical protein VFR37_08210 [Longimicrobium sp.]|nr:hypothetical protein [Longimicrobium sp.]